MTQEGLLKIEGWARDGCTDKEIAANIGINPDTLYTWKKKFPILADTLKKGKDVVDRQVEKSLLQRALGYSYEETRINRYIMECKQRIGTNVRKMEARINRYIMECKCCIAQLDTSIRNCELIDTLWNVNTLRSQSHGNEPNELIDTLWNVNSFGVSLLTAMQHELIDTLWNVNKNEIGRIRNIRTELIDTLWNVNEEIGGLRKG